MVMVMSATGTRTGACVGLGGRTRSGRASSCSQTLRGPPMLRRRGILPAGGVGGLTLGGGGGRGSMRMVRGRATEEGFPETAADGVLREGGGGQGSAEAGEAPAPKPVCFEADGTTVCGTCGGGGRQMWQLSKLIPFARSYRPCPNYRGAYRAAGQGVDEIFFGSGTDRSKPIK